MCLKTNKVLDIQLVQSNEVGNSTRMEKEGLIRSLQFLEGKNVKIGAIVTRRTPFDPEIPASGMTNNHSYSKSVVPELRVEDAVPSTDLHYVTCSPDLLGDVVPWDIGCTSLGIQDGRPVFSVSFQPTNMAARTLHMEFVSITWPSSYIVFLYVNISCIDFIL